MTVAAASTSAREQALSQGTQSLSPSVVAAIHRVHYALQEALPRLAAPFTLARLAESLAKQGLLVTLRSGLGVGAECPDYLSTLRHSFLVCQDGLSAGSPQCVIVDPSFREQFSVAGVPSTSNYVKALSSVPDCFVGTLGAVNALVCLLTGTLQQESSALGIELPPWRSTKALQSKWMPRRFADTVFPPVMPNLHPLLQRMVQAGPAAACSPASPQSWASLSSGGGCQGPCSPPRASPGACCGGAPGSSSAASTTPRSQPQTVVTGFTAPASPSCAAQRTSCGGARRHSALTVQLAAVSEALRACAEHEQAVSAQCFQECQEEQWCDSDVCCKDTTKGSQARSIVISPVYQKRCTPADAHRDVSASWKVSYAPLNELPRIHKVKLATVAAC